MRAAAYEALIRGYFDACNAADRERLVASFTSDAVHYFPPGLPGVPWRGAEAIADGWMDCVGRLGSRWTVDRLVMVGDEAVMEWTHWKDGVGTALRGVEWYVLDPDTVRIAEIRAYYAAPADPSITLHELVGFDYEGRGYPLSSAGVSA